MPTIALCIAILALITALNDTELQSRLKQDEAKIARLEQYIQANLAQNTRPHGTLAPLEAR